MAETLEARMHDLLKNSHIVAVICNQWGDTGKGKFSELFAAEWADVIARGTGGNNAGHTVVINGKEKIFHLLPSGILYDGQSKINVLGNGMVIDPLALRQELDELVADGGSYDNLMISKDAFITLPFNKEYDKQKDACQQKGGIGTTGRGIGPTYSDKVSRRGIRVEDLFNPDSLRRKVKKALDFYYSVSMGEHTKSLLHERLSHKQFYMAIKSREMGVVQETEWIIEQLRPCAERIKPLVRDTVREMSRFATKGKKILLEGAQGLLLSVEYGTYPYVTSSDCSLSGTVAGVGLPANSVDLSFGIIKYPFMTRVGAGPFPTELGGRKSEEYCANTEITRESELREHGISYEKIDRQIVYDRHNRKILDMINSEDSFVRGIGIRLAAGEYGATTGRPRRTGWTDAVAAKYAVGINGPLFILTKPDSIAGCKDFSIGYGYENDGVQTTDFNRDSDYLRGVNPVLKQYAGYPDISGLTEFEGLPPSLRISIEDFERFTGGRVAIVSNGPERNQTIIRGLS